MRIRYLACVFGLALLNAGCGIFEYSAINTVVATGRVVNEWKTRAYFRCLADKAWKEARASCPGEKFSKDYAKGFKRGFVETIDRNGTPLPPCMPPYCYRGWHHESPEGHQAIDDWFSGYRHGAAAAITSGYRDWVILPLSIPGRDKAPSVLPGTGDVAPAGAESYAPPSTLPMPREIPAPAAPVPAGTPPGVSAPGPSAQLPTPAKSIPALKVPAK